MIKVMRPHMPTADDLLPYLRRIDEAGIYVNSGPLLRQLEGELERMLGTPCTVVSNGTLSMELALRALDLPKGAEVLVPAVTYVASGQAIVNAGLTPVLCDVGVSSWQLTPEAAHGICLARRTIRAVMPVAAFGAGVRIRAWEHFTVDTNLPVIVDAAGAIHEQATSLFPKVVISYSLHATKAIGAGEGGVVSSCSPALLERVSTLANFGPGGTNAKMSEYHAAAALASIRLPSRWRADVDGWYRRHLPLGMTSQPGRQSMRTLLPMLLPHGWKAEGVQALMAEAGVETKLWYRPFLDERDEFKDCSRWGPLPMTQTLRERLIGLPYHAFLTEPDVAHACATLARILGVK